MSRLVVDSDLQTWEIFASGGRFGLPLEPMIVFHSLTEPGRRAKYVRHTGDNADAQRFVREAEDEELRQLLMKSRDLD